MKQKVIQTLIATWVILSGGKPVSYYLAGFVIAAFMAFLAIYIRAKVTRDKASVNTPEKWNSWFFIRDNVMRFCAAMIVMYLIYRSFDINSVPEMAGVGAAVAIGLDRLIVYWMDKSEFAFNLFTTDRSKFINTPK